MPFRSMAQRRKFRADPKLHKYIASWEAETPHDHTLPERLHVPKRHSAKEAAHQQELKADRGKVPGRGK